ncbi:hypothetical protein BC835DRAFT_1077456 [Cytidiella melzeri]|nr:hypothetical protein BC835DRAFT_1077456 [Cytidiella melzeri]
MPHPMWHLNLSTQTSNPRTYPPTLLISLCCMRMTHAIPHSLFLATSSLPSFGAYACNMDLNRIIYDWRLNHRVSHTPYLFFSRDAKFYLKTGLGLLFRRVGIEIIMGRRTVVRCAFPVFLPNSFRYDANHSSILVPVLVNNSSNVISDF